MTTKPTSSAIDPIDLRRNWQRLLAPTQTFTIDSGDEGDRELDPSGSASLADTTAFVVAMARALAAKGLLTLEDS